MRRMNEQLITQLETRLEKLVETAFASLFRNTLTAHDLAVQVARSMEDNLKRIPDDDPRPLAPDRYLLHLHPNIVQNLNNNHPQLPALLSDHLVEMATQSDYRLVGDPVVALVADVDLASSALKIEVLHTASLEDSTAILRPVKIERNEVQHKPYLLIDGQRSVSLVEPHINIGRSDNNDIMLDDPFVSRHHVQLRLRSGTYMLFDVNSRSGTFVNQARVREHKLQVGDVIQIGNSRLIYLVDNPDKSTGTHTTQSMDPVDPQA